MFNVKDVKNTRDFNKLKNNIAFRNGIDNLTNLNIFIKDVEAQGIKQTIVKWSPYTIDDLPLNMIICLYLKQLIQAFKDADLKLEYDNLEISREYIKVKLLDTEIPNASEILKLVECIQVFANIKYFGVVFKSGYTINLYTDDLNYNEKELSKAIRESDVMLGFNISFDIDDNSILNSDLLKSIF